METYRITVECEKCGSDDINALHKKYNQDRGRSFDKDGNGPKKEHIRCYCRNCHFEWYMGTKDSE